MTNWFANVDFSKVKVTHNYMQTAIDDILYESGLVAQGSWDEMDEYDQEAIIQAIKLTAERCFEISQNFVIKQEFDLD